MRPLTNAVIGLECPDAAGIGLLGLTFALACGGSGGSADAGWPETDPPPTEQIFFEVDWVIEVDDGDGLLEPHEDLNGNGIQDRMTRYFFDDTLGPRRCLYPDLDSFDDYENVELDIPRASTPIQSDCRADGIATGPLDLFDELYPSKWCKKPGCVPSED